MSRAPIPHFSVHALMDYLYMTFCLLFCLDFTFFDIALSTTTFSTEAEIGETVSVNLNLTKLGWHTDNIVYSVLAWNNVSYPIAKLQNGSAHSGCYNNLSFLRSVRCTDFNVTVVETNVVCIKIRLATRAMVKDYIFYAVYNVVEHNTSLVQISVHLKDTPTNTTPGESHTALSSTELPSEHNSTTAAPVKDQALRSGIHWSPIIFALSLAYYFVSVSSPS